MNCEAVERDNIIERYLAGTLEPSVLEEWEEHFFGCAQCSAQLETWTAIEQPLRAMDADIRAEMDARIRVEMEPKPAPHSSRWLWAGAAIAATLLICAAAWFGFSDGRRARTEVASNTAPAADLAELARIDPPAYAAPVLRGAESNAEAKFSEAMKLYQARDYAGAIAGLQASLREDPSAAAPRFFLGACELLTQNANGAIDELTKVAAGDSPFADEARFDLAKAYLTQGKKTEAVAALRSLAAGQGEFSDPARRLIGRISPGQPPGQ